MPIVLALQEVSNTALGNADAATPTPGLDGDRGQRQQPSALTNPTSTSTSRGGVWIRRAHLVDPRNSVTGLMFAPRFLGLQLAAISTDGVLLVYEAQVSYSLNH